MSSMISEGRGLRGRRAATRYNISTMASAPCPYFIKFGYCRDHAKEAEVKAKVIAAKEAEIMKEACTIVDDFLTATAEAAEGGMMDASAINKTSRDEYLQKIVRDLKKEKKNQDWNLELAVMDEMKRQKLHHCPFAHHRELLRDFKGMALPEGATKEERMLIHRSTTAFTSLNSNDDLLHATLEYILSFDKSFEVPEDILLSLEQKKDEDEDDEEGEEKAEEDEALLDIDAFAAEMVKLRAPIKFLEKSAFLDTSASSASTQQQQQLVIPISLNIAHLPALVEYYAPQVLATHNQKKKARLEKKEAEERAKKNGGKKKIDADESSAPLFVIPQFVVTAKQVNFSDAFFVQNFFALVAHVARTRWTKEFEKRKHKLPAGLDAFAGQDNHISVNNTNTNRVEELTDAGKSLKKDSSSSSSAAPARPAIMFPFRIFSMRYCDMINADEIFSAIKKDAYHRTNLRVVDMSHNKLDSLKFLFQLRAFFSSTSTASTNTTTVVANPSSAGGASGPNLSSGGRIISLWLAHNPITRKPDYRQQVRKTLPALLMLDGTRLRKLPLALPFPVMSRWNFPFNKKMTESQNKLLFGAYGPFYDPKKKSPAVMLEEEEKVKQLKAEAEKRRKRKLIRKKKGEVVSSSSSEADENDDDAMNEDDDEELTEEEKQRNERVKKAWEAAIEKMENERKLKGEVSNGDDDATTIPTRTNPKFQIANAKEYDAVSSFVYRYLFYWEKGEVPFSLFQHQNLMSMSNDLQKLVEDEADREHALQTAAIKNLKEEKRNAKKAAAEAAANGGAAPEKKKISFDDDEENDNADTAAAAAKKKGENNKADKKKTGGADDDDDDEDYDLTTAAEEHKRLQYARKLALLSAGEKPNVDEMIEEGLVSHLDTELYSLEGFRRGSEEVAIFAKYLNMISEEELETLRKEAAAERELDQTAMMMALAVGNNKPKATPIGNIVDISLENFATKFLHPSATVSVTVSPSCKWFDATKMFNKSEVTTSHNKLNVLDAKLLWRLTGESAALKNYFFTPPATLPSATNDNGEAFDDDDDDNADSEENAEYSSSSSSEDEATKKSQGTISLQARLSTYQVEFKASRSRKHRRGRTARRGGALTNQAQRGKLVLKSANADQLATGGITPSHVAGSKHGGYIPGYKSAVGSTGMTVSRDFLKQIMLLSPMDLLDLRLLDTAIKTHSRNLVDSLHQEVRHRVARGPMNAFNLYRSTLYPLGAINSALQSSGAVANTDAATVTAGKKVRAHLAEKMKVPLGRSGGIEVSHHLQHVPTLSVQVITDQLFEKKKREKEEAEAKKRQQQPNATEGGGGGFAGLGSGFGVAAAAAAAAASASPFGNLSAEPFGIGSSAADAPAAPSLTDEEIDALRFNSKGEKISDTALKIKVMLALREKQKKIIAEQVEKNKQLGGGGGGNEIVFQNVADPKDRKRRREIEEEEQKALEKEKAAAAAAVAAANKKGGKNVIAVPQIKFTADLNKQLFGVSLEEQSKPPFYLVTLHGTMTWRTPTMASQPLLPSADLEEVLESNGQRVIGGGNNNIAKMQQCGQKPTDVLAFAFPNGISCFCDRTLTVTAQRVEVSIPLAPIDFSSFEEESVTEADIEANVRTMKHTPPFIAALARERLAALGYVECPADIEYYKKKKQQQQQMNANQKKSATSAKGARVEKNRKDDQIESAFSTSSYGPMPQEYLRVYVRKLFIYNDHINLRPAGANNGFVVAGGGGGSSSSSSRYQSSEQRGAAVSDQCGNVVYTHLRVDKIDELELEHCGDVADSDDEEENTNANNNQQQLKEKQKKTDSSKKDKKTPLPASSTAANNTANTTNNGPTFSSRQFIQQVLERSQSDRAVYEALKEVFGAKENKSEKEDLDAEKKKKKAGNEDEKKTHTKPAAPTAAAPIVNFDASGVQQILRRHSSLAELKK